MSNPWLDTSRRYGRISRFLHWSMVLLLAWQFLTMTLRWLLDWHPRDSWMLGTHAHVGFTLWLLLFLRGAWALTNLRRRPSYGRGLLARGAGAGHLALYVLMLVVPTLALIRQYGSGKGFDWFSLVPVFPAGERQPALVDLVNATRDTVGISVHGILAWLLLALILGHIAMVGVHHFVWKDDTARRMLGSSGN